jgi:uncharacterized protein DUF559
VHASSGGNRPRPRRSFGVCCATGRSLASSFADKCHWSYIVDLLAMQHRLVVGVDGGQDATDPSDAVRARWLARQGYRVNRFWNNDVPSNPECVVTLISMAIAL